MNGKFHYDTYSLCNYFTLHFLKEFRFPEEPKAKEDYRVCIYKSNCKTVFIDEPLVPTEETYQHNNVQRYV
jgi:hypothetical protein